MITVLQAVLAGVGTALTGLLIANLRWFISIKKTVDKIQKYNERRSKQMQVLFQVQLYEITAQRTTLEVLTKQQINGNVDEAFQALRCAENVMQEFAQNEAWN